MRFPSGTPPRVRGAVVAVPNTNHPTVDRYVVGPPSRRGVPTWPIKHLYSPPSRPPSYSASPRHGCSPRRAATRSRTSGSAGTSGSARTISTHGRANARAGRAGWRDAHTAALPRRTGRTPSGASRHRPARHRDRGGGRNAGARAAPPPAREIPRPAALVRGRNAPRGRGRYKANAYTELLRRDPCAYCGKPFDPRPLDCYGRPLNLREVDHIKARSHGGANDWTNYAGACVACNRLKLDWSMLTWLLRVQRLKRADLDGALAIRIGAAEDLERQEARDVRASTTPRRRAPRHPRRQARRQGQRLHMPRRHHDQAGRWAASGSPR